MTHIDPFAPGDSPQHPSNWTADVSPRVENANADIYQWRRDHFTMTSEADLDVTPETLQERHERYDPYFDEHATDDEREEEADFVPFPVLLRRAVLKEIEAFEDEWTELFDEHATDDERDPMWVDGVLPDLAELRARANIAEASRNATADERPPAPKSNALKEEWVEYALAVAKQRGEALTFEQADAMTTSDLKAAYKPQAS